MSSDVFNSHPSLLYPNADSPSLFTLDRQLFFFEIHLVPCVSISRETHQLLSLNKPVIKVVLLFLCDS